MEKGRCTAVSHYFKKRTGKIYSRKSLPGFPITVWRKKWHKGTPRCACLRGSFTVEAAVILPMLACFFVSILFFFRVLQVELQVERAIVDAGQTLSAYAAGDGKSTGKAALKLAVMKELAGREETARYVTGGAAGVSLLASKVEGDFIDIRAAFSVEIPVRLFGRQGIKIERRVCCRKWTGRKGERGNGEDEIWVYVTETGTVYHRRRECSHLRLSVTAVNKNSVGDKRNENGGKYHECERCKDKNRGQAKVYITSQGDRYHYDLQCSGIKRTISMIKLSEVGGRSPCSRCAAEGN